MLGAHKEKPGLLRVPGLQLRVSALRMAFA
jgi:hypothetical protein